MRKNYDFKFIYNTRKDTCEIKLPSYYLDHWRLNRLLSLFVLEWAKLHAVADARQDELARSITEFMNTEPLPPNDTVFDVEDQDLDRVFGEEPGTL